MQVTGLPRMLTVRHYILSSLVACAALVVFQLADVQFGAIVAKFLASTAFILVAIRSNGIASRYGQIVIGGLVLSWFGDMFLLGKGQALFLAGLASFLFAHVAYIIAFSLRGLNVRWSVAAAVPIATVSMLVSLWLAPYLPHDMVVPVRAYTFVISLMVIAAFGTKGAGGPALIPAGALLFYLSDLSVATMQFTDPDFPNYVWGLPFYYTGQLLLAMSVKYAKPRA